MELARRGFFGRFAAVVSGVATATALSSKAKASPPEVDAAHLEAIRADLAHEEKQRLLRLAAEADDKRKAYEQWLAQAQEKWNAEIARQAEQRQRAYELDQFRKWNEQKNHQLWVDKANGRSDLYRQTWTDNSIRIDNRIDNYNSGFQNSGARIGGHVLTTTR